VKKIEIPRVEVSAEASGDRPVAVVSSTRGITVEVSELPEFGGIPGKMTPLELFLAGLASCEVFMFKMVADALGVGKSFRVAVSASGRFKLGEGLVELKLLVRVKGIERGLAEKIWSIVKAQCPIYSTLRRSVESVDEELLVEP
jgi:uncharacterized OsmC-like protein